MKFQGSSLVTNSFGNNSSDDFLKNKRKNLKIIFQLFALVSVSVIAVSVDFCMFFASASQGYFIKYIAMWQIEIGG